MAKKPAASVEVICPCCHARLVVDAKLAAVISHEPPPKAAPGVDLDDTARILQEQARQREEKFLQSWEAEKKKEDVLARKFEESLRKAKDQPVEKPLRDIDLD